MKQKRNYGIDLLRIVSTFMVIILHVLGVGGVIYKINSTSHIYAIAWLLEFAAYCAVNCYALISGYVGVDSKFRISNILHLWVQVTVTTVIITLVFYFSGIDISLQDLRESCTPITSQLYWYFTAYVALYFLTPFLNLFVINLNKKMATYFLVISLMVFSVIPTFCEKDLFFVNNGYSVAWLIILYLVGGIIKKHYIVIKLKKRVLFGGYLLSVIITLLSKLIIEYLAKEITFTLLGSNFLMNYNSPTMVWAGVSLLLIFSNIKVDKLIKPIVFVAPVTFGVYIIHTHPIVWKNLITNRFAFLIDLHPSVFVVAVFLVAIGIFGACTIIEFVRIKIFRVLHVVEFCKFIEMKCKRIIERV